MFFFSIYINRKFLFTEIDTLKKTSMALRAVSDMSIPSCLLFVNDKYYFDGYTMITNICYSIINIILRLILTTLIVKDEITV